MAAFTSAGRGRVFISYRREDSAFPAGWLYDRLCAHLGSDNVFKDVDSIDPGDDFVRVIGDAVGSCQVLLALIGDRWLDITDGTGHRRLDDPEDFVRLEIEAALRRDVRVIPILVGRAALPGSEQLPDSLRGLIRRQVVGAVIGAVVLAAFLIRDSGFTTTTTSKAASTTSAQASGPTSAQASGPTSAQASGPNKTIQDYMKENKIVETPIHRGDPGSPTIDLPVPPGWSDAGPSTPEWAYPSN